MLTVVDENPDSPDRRADLGRSLYRVAELESMIHRVPPDAETIQQPIEIFKRLHEKQPDEPEHRYWLARSLHLKSQAIRRQNAAEGLEVFEEAAEVLGDPTDAAERHLPNFDLSAKIYTRLGSAYESMGRGTETMSRARDNYLKGLDVIQVALAQTPDAINRQTLMAGLERD